MTQPKMTLATQAVLRALLDHTGRPAYVREIAHATGLDTGTVAPILIRLTKAGWLTGRWEDADPRKIGRPRRRYYQLTDSGTEQARQALATRKGRPG